MLRIKTNDLVMIMAGKDKGKTGKVRMVFPSLKKAVVENLNLVKKVRRKTQQDPQGGITDIEAPIHLSNLMLIDKQTNQPTRFGISPLRDGTKMRVSKKSGAAI